ncbi:uncharacterized protein TNCV_1977461 [Trichonephila clavipes]|nr:uncharacterized protein TNCV_1977461 [Trichonephila clavipes]
MNMTPELALPSPNFYTTPTEGRLSLDSFNVHHPLTLHSHQGCQRRANQRLDLSDEAHFWLNGYVNKQNGRIWSEANPQVYVETPLHQKKKKKTDCWVRFMGWWNPSSKTMKATTLQSMVIARATIDLLKDTLGDRLISRFGPVNWPPRSCDLSPLDYFLWGYVKSLVYTDKPQTLDHLEDNIRRVIADIRPQMLEKVIENWTSRLDYIRASRGSHMPEIIFKM